MIARPDARSPTAMRVGVAQCRSRTRRRFASQTPNRDDAIENDAPPTARDDDAIDDTVPNASSVMKIRSR